MVAIVVAVLVAAIVIIAAFWFFKNQFEKEAENKFSKLSHDALESNREEFLVLAEQVLERKKSEAKSDLDMRKQAIQDSINGLEGELEKYKSLIHEFEQDRTKKYGSLENELKNTSKSTAKLQETTNRLTDVLGNVKKRGEWGERQAEVIIGLCGLIEGRNYKKQAKQASVGTKPDYTFLLPDHHKINMDVKFPLDNYTNFVNTEEEIQREHYKKEFLKNVSDRIKEIQTRDYINPAENTLDFVLLFIPNEQIYGFIQESIPDIIDKALKQKVVLCSPFTLYAMLSVIHQSFENFYYEKSAMEIIKMINLFTKTYDVFKSRFEKLGKSIDGLESQYEEINSKSFKELDTKIRRINDYKSGHIASSEDDSSNIIEITKEGMIAEQKVSEN
ncbi:DNA recombination protein RmuC [Candidatus Omnitrophota bacterium]